MSLNPKELIKINKVIANNIISIEMIIRIIFLLLIIKPNIPIINKKIDNIDSKLHKIYNALTNA